MRTKHLLVVAFFLVTALGWSAKAHADMGPHISSGWYLPVGLNLGASLHPKVHHGFLVGGEVSFVHLGAKKLIWAGGYVDALHDLGAKATRFSFGPEFGWSIVGIDAGYMGDVRDGEYHHGMTIRAMLTLGIVTLYGRWGHVFGLERESDFGEIGFLFKAPIPLKVDPYTRPGPPELPSPDTTPDPGHPAPEPARGDG